LSVIETQEGIINSVKSVLKSLNPENILKQGYAILTGEIKVGGEIGITTSDESIIAEVKSIKKRD
jgi:exonuclease VII large subunit